MFRDLARCTARIKGERYKGAVIAAAAWERGGTPGRTADGLPATLADRHGMMTVQAADESGTLTIKMLLGRKAPVERTAGGEGVLHLEARAEGARAASIRLQFATEDVREFVEDVGDTNELHEGEKPLVPGLLILERLLKQMEFITCRKIFLKYTTPVFAGQEVIVHSAPFIEGGGPRSGRGSSRVRKPDETAGRFRKTFPSKGDS